MTIAEERLLLLNTCKKICNQEGWVWLEQIIKSIEPEWRSRWDLLVEREAAEMADEPES